MSWYRLNLCLCSLCLIPWVPCQFDLFCSLSLDFEEENIVSFFYKFVYDHRRQRLDLAGLGATYRTEQIVSDRKLHTRRHTQTSEMVRGSCSSAQVSGAGDVWVLGEDIDTESLISCRVVQVLLLLLL